MKGRTWMKSPFPVSYTPSTPPRIYDLGGKHHWLKEVNICRVFSEFNLMTFKQQSVIYFRFAYDSLEMSMKKGYD